MSESSSTPIRQRGTPVPIRSGDIPTGIWRNPKWKQFISYNVIFLLQTHFGFWKKRFNFTRYKAAIYRVCRWTSQKIDPRIDPGEIKMISNYCHEKFSNWHLFNYCLRCNSLKLLTHTFPELNTVHACCCYCLLKTCTCTWFDLISTCLTVVQ